MAAGDIEARLIPQSSKTGTVIVTNATDRRLLIKLPGSFCRCPVLAQRRGGGAAAGGVGELVALPAAARGSAEALEETEVAEVADSVEGVACSISGRSESSS